MILARRSWAEARRLQPIGRFIGTQISGCEPDEMGIGPVLAIPALLRYARAELNDIDTIELNEAFASQMVYCLRELEMDVDRVNPNGGAIALGHPTGATGVRQAATLLAELKRTDKEMGIISMCARDVLNRHFKSHHDNDGTKVAATRSQPRPTEPVSPPQDTIIAQPTNLGGPSIPSGRASTHSSLSGVASPDDTNNVLQLTSTLSYTLHPIDPPSPSSSNDRGLSGTPPNRQQQPAIANQETHHSFSLPDLMPTLSEDAIYDPGMLSCLDGRSLQGTLTNSVEAAATADESSQRPQKRVCLSDHEMSQIMRDYVSRTWQPPSMNHTPDWLSMLDTDMAPTEDRSAGAIWPSTTPLDNTYGFSHPDHSQALHLRTHRKSSLGSEIPDERFTRVSKLWSKTGERPWQLMQTLWSDVINAPEDNIFSESSSEQDHLDGPSPILTADKDTNKFDDRRRMSLSKEYGVQNTSQVAQQHGLFESAKDHPLSVVLDRGQMDSNTWKAWAKVESAKRVISSLIMIDALFASNMSSGPMIRTDTIHIYVPCSTSLFAATNAERWAQLEVTTPSLHHTTLDFRTFETKLPTELSLSSIAMTTLMSVIWLRFADARHRLLLKSDIRRQPTLFPGEIYEEDASGIALVRTLRDIQSTFREDLSRGNPNHVVFWHKMCMSIFANIELFEIAAGRDGAQEGKVALEHINTWAQTSFARRACLHAAQTYAAMSRRRVADGTAFQTESAIFHSALVLGLYCFAAPVSLRESVSSPGLAPYELLDDVDWNQLGDGGLNAQNVSCARPLTAAELFVIEGGAITFSGVIHEGGFGSSRRIFLAYIGLLEEVGKWKAGEYCRILRLMSDSNLDLGMY
ncbi:hypothetical protein NW762_012486 [Fusarium torreyae]|uniref:Thiolase C-terminal domain-containing protein n=1 Tax=Fusarium torreyae TaxID=1237075 RepID=A0A9W8V9P0_9HYPO|nr:hypothetical protein NW762_012486 [Fusarium torreyae]